MTTTTKTVRSPALVLAVLCVCVLVINMDAMIVNVALPSLVEQLHSTTRELQWIADAYSLTFAALVIAAGSLSDRFGRRGALVGGLALFTLASGLGAFSTTTWELIAARAVMGIGSAFIYPATLSILTNVFVDRKARAAAIGVWGAVSGIGIVLGPLVGGVLLQYFWWGSVFLAMAPIGLLSLLLVAGFVPTSRDPETPPLDKSGLLLSCLSTGVLIYAIIEAPRVGWGSGYTLVGFLAAVLLWVALLVREAKARIPMIDVSLFGNPKFSAACGAMTIAFFTLYGWVFLFTQYLQFVKQYSPMQTGLQLIPVAIGMTIGSMLGSNLAVKLGTRTVVTVGLAVLTLVFLWFITESADTGFVVLGIQLLLIGLGLGTVAIPATDAIMGVVPPAKASLGSALNDATRLLGGALGVAVIGSLFQSFYTQRLAGPVFAALAPDAQARVQDSIGNALTEAGKLTGAQQGLRAQLTQTAQNSFLSSFSTSCVIVAVITAVMVVVAWFWLPAQAPSAAAEPEAEADAGQPAVVES